MGSLYLKENTLGKNSGILKKLKDLAKNLKDLATQGYEKKPSMLRSQVTPSDYQKSPQKKPDLILVRPNSITCSG